MLENGLFFILGFLLSALIALLAAPAIWRRAVTLTRKRIESSVPLTLNEIQADKDQLRAEFAMSTRRLEVNLDKLKERAAEQKIEINRRRDEMLELETTEAEKSGRILELEAQSTELRAEVKSRETSLSETTASLNNVQSKLEERAASFEQLDSKYRVALDDFDGQKIEMVARETRLDTIQGDAKNTRDQLKSQGSEQKELVKQLKALTASLKKQERQNLELNEKLIRHQSQSADMEGRLERRNADIARLRENSGDSGSQLSTLEKQLDASEADKLELETQLATLTLRMEASLGNIDGKPSKNSIASYESDSKKFRGDLQKLEEERDALKIELSAVQLAAEDGWDVERRENAIVRERINDLAAQVTAMTATIEGPESPINVALAKKGRTAKRKTKSSAKSKTQGASIENVSLGERIHALQKSAEKA